MYSYQELTSRQVLRRLTLTAVLLGERSGASVPSPFAPTMCIFCTPDPPQTALTDAEQLAAEKCPNLATRVPVTIVTGFLGAGKTTLVNWLLKGSHGLRICVLQNEFGSVPVDDGLIVRSERFAEVAVMTMPTGCICCKVRGDLVEGLKALARGAVGCPTRQLSSHGSQAQFILEHSGRDRRYRGGEVARGSALRTKIWIFDCLREHHTHCASLPLS